MGLLFQDELNNPMAAGVEVKLYPLGVPQSLDNLIATDWTQSGGLCPNLYAVNGQSYIALFTGRQGPRGAQALTGNGSSTLTVQCSPYRSPTMTTTNWANLIANRLLPKGTGWWGDEFLQTAGGVAWAMAYAMGAMLQFYDQASQDRLQVARLQSSAGPDVDTWAYDFLGQWVPRYTGEMDPSFKNRIYAALANPKTTLAALLAIVTAFYQAMQLSSGGGLAFDSGVGAFDSPLGAFDLLTAGAGALPTINVWDHQSRPDLDAQYKITQHFGVGWFVIQLGFALPSANTGWFLGYSALGYDTYLINIDSYEASLSAPDPRLSSLVDFIKAGGTKPIYLTSFLSSP